MRKALWCGCAALVLLATPAAAKTTIISFDGECITLQVTTSGEDFVTAMETDPNGSCATFIGEGRIGTVNVKGVSQKIADISGTQDNNTEFGATTYDLSFPFITGGAWTAYQTTGGNHHKVYRAASGTYTVTDGAIRSPRAGTKRLIDVLRPQHDRSAKAGDGQ